MTTNPKKTSGKKTREYLVIEGRKIAVSWWGAAWNMNLESYSDYANRLPPRENIRARRPCL